MKRKVFLLSVLVLLLFATLSLCAFAEGEPLTEIRAHNLKVTDHVEMIYYVAFAENPAAYDAAGVLIFTSEKSEYTTETADANLASYGATQATAVGTYYKYYYDGLADYQMGDILYARPYYVVGAEVVYGSVDSYSVLQYVMEQTGKTGFEPRETLVPILEQLLEEGAAAQIEANYKVDQLVTGEYGYLTLEGAVLPDGISANGGFLVGQEVTLTGIGATIVWYNEAGTQIATGKTLDVTVTADPQLFRAVCTEHDYEAILVSPATCTASALYLDTCECGAVSGDPYTVGEALGHTPVIDPAVAATCTETGLTAGTHCSVCGTVLTAQEVVAALGHDLVHHDAQAATCTEIGWAAYDTCSRCDYTTYEEVAALGHNYEAVVTAPTCTTGGYTTHTCSRCSDSYIDTYTDALGHIEVIDAAVDPTCTETGLTAGTHCSVCNAVLTAQEVVAALGHDLVHHDAQAATCTEIGWAAYDTCSRCDYTTYEEVAALGHDYEAAVTAPTCTAQGYTTHTCSRCSDSYIDTYTDALRHIEVIDAAVDPTCTETGLTAGKHCSRCDAVLVAQEVVPATGHNYEAVVTAPTCTAQGYATHTCSRCSDSYIDTYTEALGHNWDAGVVTTQPTCTGAGEKTYTCSRCGATDTETVAALEHNYEAVVTAPTCTAQGYTTHTCSRCSDSYVDTYTDALGHIEVIDAAVDPTCTETGLTAGKHCSRCDAVLVAQEVVPATGVHTYDPQTGFCTNCGEGNVIYTSNGDGTCKVTGLKSKTYDDVYVVIAETSFDGDQVTSIAANAFVGSHVEEVVIPKTVTTIEENAFYDVPIMAVYYGGSQALWDSITFENGNGTVYYADVYYYTENQPSANGMFWHWVDGVLTVWPPNTDEYGELHPSH